MLFANDVAYVDLDLSAGALGFTAQAVIWLTVSPSSLADAGLALVRKPEVAFAGAVTGTHNLTATVVCRASPRCIASSPTASARDWSTTNVGLVPDHDHVDEIRVARFADLDGATLYRLLALRSEIFVVEQECPYQDLDGRDLEASARQLWIERDGDIVATLRLLVDDDGSARIGRVATKQAARGSGVAAKLMRHALELAGDDPVVLDAQAYLHDWYARFGFVRDGDDYIEDGIPHIPMRLAD